MDIKNIIKEEMDGLEWMDDIVPTRIITMDNMEIGMRVKINTDLENYYSDENDMEFYLKQSGDGGGVIERLDDSDFEWVNVVWDNDNSNTYPINDDEAHSLIQE